MPPAERWPVRLLIANLENLVAFAAARRAHLDRIALALADERARNRRSHRDAALLHIGFEFTDDLIGGLLVGLLIDQSHMGAELDGVAGKLGNIDHIGTADLILKLGDARLKPALLFLCGMIFGVFGEIAMRARFFDRPD